MIKQVIVVAGGSPALWPDISCYSLAETIWIGVDRGAYYLLQKGIIPKVAVGDFDSLSPDELREVALKVGDIRYAQPEKDDTDTQLGIKLALALVDQGELLLIGATGGRIDHLLSNLWLPLEERFQKDLQRIKLLDNQNTISYFLPGDYTLRKEESKKYLGYICLTAVSGLTIFDAKYRLEDYQTTFPMSFASNEFVGETSRFKFTSGVIAVIQSKDLT